MKNKSWRVFCLLLSFCMFLTSGCNFGGTEQAVTPPAQEEKSDGQTTEIIVPGGKEDQAEEDKEKTEEKDKKEEKDNKKI